MICLTKQILTLKNKIGFLDYLIKYVCHSHLVLHYFTVYVQQY